MDLFGFHKHGGTARNDGSQHGSPAIQSCVSQAASDKPTSDDGDMTNKRTRYEVATHPTPTTDKSSSSRGSSTVTRDVDEATGAPAPDPEATQGIN